MPHTINNTSIFLIKTTIPSLKKIDTLYKAAYYPRMQTYLYSYTLLHMQNNNEITLTLATLSAINVLK